MKKLLIVAACLALALLLSLGLVAACVVRGGQHLSFAFDLDEKASREETHELDIEAGKVLAVELPAGRIRVSTSADTSPSLIATITAFGGSQEKANQALSETRLDLEGSHGGLRIRLLNQTSEGSVRGLARNAARADLEFRIPPGVRLDLASGSGDVECDGAFASSKVHSSYGAVRIRGVEGDVDATSSSGDVSVSGARGKRLVAKSDYGDVEVSGSEAEAIEARSSSGDVRLEDVKGERTRVGSSYGDVELLDVDGEIEAKLSSGNVDLVRWSGSKASVSTDYGNVRVEKGTGSVEAKSSSGDVRVRDLEGSLAAHSSYGSVHAEGVFFALQADSSSGDVSAHSRSGSRVEDGWKLSSSYGDVKLVLPDGFAFDLSAETAYGDVEIGFPIEIQPGKHKKGSQSVRGKVNGGGGSIELRCTSGDVKVETDRR